VSRPSDSTQHAPLTTGFRRDHRTVLEIRQGIIKQSKQDVFSQLFHSKNDKEKIAAWKSELNRALLVFNVSFAVYAQLLLSAKRLLSG